jgi:hypothetical protein
LNVHIRLFSNSPNGDESGNYGKGFTMIIQCERVLSIEIM